MFYFRLLNYECSRFSEGHRCTERWRLIEQLLEMAGQCGRLLCKRRRKPWSLFFFSLPSSLYSKVSSGNTSIRIYRRVAKNRKSKAACKDVVTSCVPSTCTNRGGIHAACKNNIPIPHKFARCTSTRVSTLLTVSSCKGNSNMLYYENRLVMIRTVCWLL